MKSPRQKKLLIANDGAIYFYPRQGVFISKLHKKVLSLLPSGTTKWTWQIDAKNDTDFGVWGVVLSCDCLFSVVDGTRKWDIIIRGHFRMNPKNEAGSDLI
jgi:hypothetical protein